MILLVFRTIDPSFPMITSNTVQELVKLPHFSNLTHFSLRKVPEIFDIESFYDYIKVSVFTDILHIIHNNNNDF